MSLPTYYRDRWESIYDSLLAERFDGYQAKLFNLFGLASSSGGVDAYFDEVLQQANPLNGERAVDVCCGTGTLAIKIAKGVGTHGEVWGVDLSEGLLAVAREKYGSENVGFIHGNAQELPFETECFDLATVTTALHEMVHSDRVKVLEELFRVLKPGGRLIIGEQRKHERRLMRILWWILIAPFCLPELGTLRDMYRCGLENEINEVGLKFIYEVPVNLGFMRVMVAVKPRLFTGYSNA